MIPAEHPVAPQVRWITRLHGCHPRSVGYCHGMAEPGQLDVPASAKDGTAVNEGITGSERPQWLAGPPAPPSGTTCDVPESGSYRLKRLLLGRPLINEDLQGQRLGKPTALAVLSSDVMSSSAYASESILRILVPAAGLAAFSLVTPITAILLLVLGIVCLCYRQVVAAYPVSGGSYVVSRDNFGYAVAQIPGAALLLSYVLTVAVSVAAGADAVISAFPKLSPYPVELTIGFILVLTYGNLRGIREAGRVFAVPTYWFLVSMGLMIVSGLVRLGLGSLPRYPLHAAGHIAVGASGGGLLLGVSVFLFLRAFANGGSAMTGMEAISNAVPVFREPRVRNARTTLALMASILGILFLSVSIFAALVHAVPYVSGTPTVLSEVGNAAFGSGGFGRAAYYSLQFSTGLILILGANTSYNGFPLLVSFIAKDAYLPRPLTTRGHRLVYSNGIIALTVVSILLLVVTRAQVSNLIPLYAATVFTGFTMAGAGMTKYHLKHQSPHRRRHLAVAAAAFVSSGVVTLIFVVTEFTRGAWLVVVAIPLLVLVLTRTHHRYQGEQKVLAEGAMAKATKTSTLRKHVVLVLVDSLDLATARAIQLASSLSLTSELRAVHFVIDAAHAEEIARQWGEFGVPTLPLELIECPDRRLPRAATEFAADLASDGQTEVTLVLPRRMYRGVANRLLHSNTADRIVAAVSSVPNVSATIAPFDVGGHFRRRSPPTTDAGSRSLREPVPAKPPAADTPTVIEFAGTVPIGDIQYRQRQRIGGRIRSVRVQPWSGAQAVECTVVDGTGAVNLVFLGRRSVPGIETGAYLTAEGMVGKHRGRLAIINPGYELTPGYGRSAVH